MKFNVTYTPNTDQLQTLKDIALIKAKLVKSISSMKKFTQVTPPLFLEENDLRVLDMSSKTRSVTFDFGDQYKVGVLSLSHTNWLRDLIYKTDLPYNEGLYTEGSYIWRDAEQNPTSSPVKDEITFQFKISEEESIAKVRELAEDVYESITKISKEFKEKYDFRNSYPDFAEYISAQQLANEMPGETFRQRETDMALEKHAFVFEAPGFKLHSGDTHSLIPAGMYDLKNFYQLVFLDKVNSTASKVASIAILASGQVLNDQLHLNDLSDLLTNDFYAELAKREYKIIEIKINIPRLAMIILEKGHIGEVQAGVISTESLTVKEKNRIKII